MLTRFTHMRLRKYERFLDMVKAGVVIKISPSYILRVFRVNWLKVLPLIADELFIEYGFLIRDMDN